MLIPTKYLLLVDSDQRVIDIQVAALKYFYGGEVHTAQSCNDAVQILNTLGKPELIFADFEMLREQPELYAFLEKHDLRMPILAYSDAPDSDVHHKHFPIVSSVLEKPVSVKSFTYLVKGITTIPTVIPTHVPVKIGIVLGLGSKDFDYYIRLSGTNYVKVIHKGESFTREDADKFSAKGVKDIYISASESHNFLKKWEEQLHNPKDSSLTSMLVVENLEQYEGLAKSLGWNREVILSAQKTVSEAIKYLSKNSKIAELLNQRLSNPTSKYSRHVGLLSFLTCTFSANIEWIGESGQNKLAMASLLHDLAVEDHYYEDIQSWNARAANPKDRTPEVLKYRLHTLEASKLAMTHESLPPDVEQILLLHHERMDGSGFPRALTASRINHLASMFIMCEELIDFIDDGEMVATSLRDFLTWGDSHYNAGHFRKVFEIIKAKVIADNN